MSAPNNISTGVGTSNSGSADDKLPHFSRTVDGSFEVGISEVMEDNTQAFTDIENWIEYVDLRCLRHLGQVTPITQ